MTWYPQVKARTPQMVAEFEVKALSGVNGRSNRHLAITPDGKIIVLCTSNGTVAYSIESKQKLYGLDFPRTSTYSFCNDPPLMAVGRYDQKADFSIRDLSTGRQVCTIPLGAAVTKAAFSPDGSLVYVGLRSKVLRAYRVSDGKPAQEIITPIAPVAIPPTGNRFVGFMFDSPGGVQGSTVLADFDDGHSLAVLNAAGNINNDGYFSPDARAFIFGRDRDVADDDAQH